MTQVQYLHTRLNRGQEDERSWRSGTIRFPFDAGHTLLCTEKGPRLHCFGLLSRVVVQCCKGAVS